jgi:hypothetical protein
MKFLPTITTTPGSNWREKINEIRNLDVKEVAVFPTFLNEEERRELYALLLRAKVRSVPFVHLRNDMKLSELDYFVKKYNTQIFNIHSEKEYSAGADWEKYKNIICLENTPYTNLDEEEVKKWAGICLDFSHLEDNRLLNKEKYENDSKIIEKYPIRCNHISAVKEKVFLDEEEKMRCTSHTMHDRSELDYLKKYPLNYFTDFCALELENKIVDQLAAIDYINVLLRGRDEVIKGMGF